MSFIRLLIRPVEILGVFIFLSYCSVAYPEPVQPSLFSPVSLSLDDAAKVISDSKINACWAVSRKYDGVRAYWNGNELLSRQGYKINAPAWFKKALPPFELDGELWIGTGRFSEVNGVINSGADTKKWDQNWRKVRYRVFEAPNQPGDLFSRLVVLKRFLNTHPADYLKIVKQRKVESLQQLETFYQKVIDQGGEGIIVRDASLGYQTGRLKSVIKIKPYQDAECIVQGYKEGKGRLKGWVGSLACALLNRQKVRLFPKLSDSQKTVIYLGSGLTDKEREKPPEIGSMVTFKYSGLTSKGLPRFAVFLRQRMSAKQVKEKQLGWAQPDRE